jgi:hypothetical protein
MKTPEETDDHEGSQGERGGAASAGSSGAPPSNRAPDSCNGPRYRLLSRHVDSLELSYRGRLKQYVDRELANLKVLAQSREDAHQAFAQLCRGEHVLAVEPKGKGLFPYVASDPATFRIVLAGASAKSLPMASCQIRNATLMALGAVEAERRLRVLLAELGNLESDAVVSRIDLAADFVTVDNLEAVDSRAWVTRLRNRQRHMSGERFTGFSLGSKRDPASGGLYDKAQEIAEVSQKYYMHEVWVPAGWDRVQAVWRFEARFRREHLRLFGLQGLPGVLGAVPSLWARFLTEALRLAVPMPSDATRSRWPNHPLWDFLLGVYWGAPATPLARMPRKVGAPSDEYFARQVSALLSSYMAAEGILDPGKAWLGIEQLTVRHLARRAQVTGLNPDEMLIERARAKGRRFGTLVNVASGAQSLSEAADAYRGASDGV